MRSPTLHACRDSLLQALCLTGLALFAACSSAELPELTEDDPSADASVNGTPVRLTFNFSLQFDATDDSFDFPIELNDDFALRLYVNQDGTVAILANDFPRMVYRLCAEGSETDGCHSYYDEEDEEQWDLALGGSDFDIVIDSCGSSIADEDCGAPDDTTFTGTLSTDGTLVLENMAFRVRAFFVTEELDGYTAEDSDTGLLTSDDSIRLTISRITTGAVAINAGDNLSAEGAAVENSMVTLVGAGVIPSSVPDLGGSYFIGTIDGTFSYDPLSLLEEEEATTSL